jgi:hypothetical protein
VRASVQILLTVAGVWLLSTAPGRPDTYSYYGSVVCSGNDALVRFAGAWNEDFPDFTSVPESPANGSLRYHFHDGAPDFSAVTHGLISTELRTASLDHPGDCRLADGRQVTVRHMGAGDALGYGECGADETQVFSLWIGSVKVYDRETFHNKCGFEYDIAAIVFRGETLTECRLEFADLHGTLAGDGLVCRDASPRLGVSLEGRERLGHFELIRSAEGRSGFCFDLVDPWGAGLGAVVGTDARWPALAIAQTYEVAAGERRAFARGGLEELVVDFDNDGTLDRAVSVTEDNHYFDGRFWIVFDTAASSEAIAAMREELYANPDDVAVARTAGWRVFAGNQTDFRSSRYTTLTPFAVDRELFLHARWVFRRFGEVSDVVLLPSPEGLEEICAWRPVPPL